MRWLRASSSRRISAWSFCALIWLLAAATVAQAVFPRNAIASCEADGEPSEEESDPTESAEVLPQLCDGASASVTRLPVVSSRRLFPSQFFRTRGPAARRHLSGGLAKRNGFGGPLRC